MAVLQQLKDLLTANFTLFCWFKAEAIRVEHIVVQLANEANSGQALKAST
jgi:hypothetical protein